MKLGPIRNTRRKVGRNESCPFCTSGKKFKSCHGSAVTSAEQLVCVAAGHPQERPVRFESTGRVHKGPRPAERKVID